MPSSRAHGTQADGVLGPLARNPIGRMGIILDQNHIILDNLLAEFDEH